MTSVLRLLTILFCRAIPGPGMVFAVCFASALVLPGICLAEEEEGENDFEGTEYSLEQLQQVEVVTPFKREEKISEIPSAVFIITQEDIQRAGVSTIPDALALAPGVQVARISDTEWAVNIRGLNQQYSNKLLVFIDGRSIYSHVLSGVSWDYQGTLMEDIERIEVIRGPGAVVWGSNAVNGVINIITKKAKDTHGAMAVLSGGTEEDIASLRYGGHFGDYICYRIYGKFFNRGGEENDDKPKPGNDSNTDWYSRRAGFRLEWEPEDSLGDDIVTIQGEIFANKYDTIKYNARPIPPHYENTTSRVAGGHMMAHWRHLGENNSDNELKLYFESIHGNLDEMDGNYDIFDVEFQQRLSASDRLHDVVWGIGYRMIFDQIFLTEPFEKSNSSFDQDLISAFIEDDIQLIQDRLHLTLGVKFEHNDITGFEIQPSVRLRWTPVKKHVFWAAISRAVRTPSRLESKLDLTIYQPENLNGEWNGNDIISTITGNDDLAPEELIAYEIGYRMIAAKNLWMDIAVFYSDYDSLIDTRLIDIGQVEAITSDSKIYYLSYENYLEGNAYGAEISGNWKPLPWWKLSLSYSYLHTDMEIDDDLRYLQEGSEAVGGDSPSNLVSLRSSMDFPQSIKFDLWLRYVGRLKKSRVDSYTGMDAQLSWLPLDNLEVSIGGKNLFEPRHREFSSYEVERSAYLKLMWNF